MAEYNGRKKGSLSRCGKKVESIEHILLHCSFAKAVWFGCPLLIRIPSDYNCSLSSWIEEWINLKDMDSKDQKQANSLCNFIAWTLWLARNDGALGSCRLSLEEVHSASKKTSSQSGVAPVPLMELWKLPSHPFFKLNCDASKNPKSEKQGMGVIIRNYEGHPVLAKLEISYFVDIDEGEALGIRTGMLEAMAMGVDFLEVESDCKGVTELILNPGRAGALQVQPIISDILFLAPYFFECEFSFISREANLAADSLAWKALSLQNTTVWPLPIPGREIFVSPKSEVLFLLMSVDACALTADHIKFRHGKHATPILEVSGGALEGSLGVTTLSSESVFCVREREGCVSHRLQPMCSIKSMPRYF
ncbi:uncharacterized protein LOC122662977 [Telopea speciosissima]|uniref:uncharacterized protein LOC122662977 n=1 Tax=Telopea speciosissima TaxID=54955 RepID=UPI001CC407AE|nr:uncharacterized protein LOC122662977 [Telopea speciosissima]